MDSLIELFCHIDDFCKAFTPVWQQHMLRSGAVRRQRDRRLSLSEIMTILIHFQQSHYRNFKAYYGEYVLQRLHWAFPGSVSLQRFVEFIPCTVIPLCVYLHKRCLGRCTGISFVDSIALRVCLNRRIAQHNVFAGLAERGKTSTGWSFGFKLHLVFSDRGYLLSMALTPGNVDDRQPLPRLVCRLFGKLFGDKGYLSQPLFEQLFQTSGIQPITKLKKNMKNRLMPLADKLLLRKRTVAETIIDRLRNISQIEHSRHRSPMDFLANLLCGLIAYCHRPRTP